jgi:hypothetical protein
VRAF